MQINEQYYIRIEKIIHSKITKVAIFILTILIIILCLVSKKYDFLGASLFPIMAYYFLKQSVNRKNFMMKYAKDNNLNFEYFKIEAFPARLFKIGNQNGLTKVLNLIHGTYNNYPIKIFHHKYSVDYGKNEQTFYFTVCEVEITNLDFPFILLSSRSMMKHAETDYVGYKKDTKIRLEPEFENKFNLYCRNDYEIEVLQIFNKELLSYLVEHGNKFSIEFAKNKIYIYDDRIIENQKEMDEIYNILKKIIDNSSELLKRLQDDFEVMHEVYKKTKPN